jgi:hypothetical protein
MTFRRTNSSIPAIVASILAAIVIVSACSSNSNKEPTPSSEEGGSAGESSTGGKSSAGGKSSTGGKSSANSGGEAGSDVGGGNAGSTTTTVLSSCVPDTSKNCYSCSPEANTQFLNACNSAGERPGCRPYENSKLTKLVNGKVPALP